MLLIVGEKLVEASVARAVWLNENYAVSDEVLHVSGTALRGAAEALLEEQWEHADHFLSVARSNVSPLFPQEQLATLQGMLSGSSALESRAALADLGRVLENQAHTVSDACLGEVCVPLQDAFFEAAGALSAAARLLDKSRAASTDSSRAPAPVEQQKMSPAFFMQEIDRALAAVETPKERKSVLRQLARRFHPDRNPGREAAVLPAFRTVQTLRSEARWL